MRSKRKHMDLIKALKIDINGEKSSRTQGSNGLHGTSVVEKRAPARVDGEDARSVDPATVERREVQVPGATRAATNLQVSP